MATLICFLQRMDAIFPVARGPEPCRESNPAEPEGLGYAPPRAKRRLPKGPYSKPAPAAEDGPNGDGKAGSSGKAASVSSASHGCGSIGKARPIGRPPRPDGPLANPDTVAVAKAVPFAPPAERGASAPTASTVSQTERFAGLFLAFQEFFLWVYVCIYRISSKNMGYEGV